MLFDLLLFAAGPHFGSSNALFQHEKPGLQGQVRVQWLCLVKFKYEARSPSLYKAVATNLK
jgi:hypothetical protein